jgi:hypothetical protein
MALTKAALTDLVLEERQIQVKKQKLAAVRDEAKVQAQRTCATAITQADQDYNTAMQAAESRLADITAMLSQQGAWGEP